MLLKTSVLNFNHAHYTYKHISIQIHTHTHTYAYLYIHIYLVCGQNHILKSIAFYQIGIKSICSAFVHIFAFSIERKMECVCVCVYLCESKRNVCSFQYFQNVLINKNIMFLFLDSFPIEIFFKFTVTHTLRIPSLSTQHKFFCLSFSHTHTYTLSRHDGGGSDPFPSSPIALQFSHFKRKTIQIKRNEKSRKTNFQGLENWNRQTFWHKIELKQRVLCLLDMVYILRIHCVYTGN